MKKIILFLFVFSMAANAQTTSSQDKAMLQTQDLLQDQNQRDAYIKSNKQAAKADEYLKQLTGGDTGTNQEIYMLAAEVFQMFAKRANGDDQKMQDELAKFAKDPQGFAKTWPPEQQAKLKELANKLNTGKLKPN